MAIVFGDLNWIMFFFFVFSYAVSLWKDSKEFNLIAGGIALILGISLLNEATLLGFMFVIVGIYVLGSGIGDWL